jgi:hypothetical protein
VGPRAGLDEVVMRKNFQPLPGLEPPIIHSVAHDEDENKQGKANLEGRILVT